MEGLTLITLICVAVPMKHIFGFAVATKIVGPIHGIAFLVYFWALIGAQSDMTLSRKEQLWLYAGAFIPFGFLKSHQILAQKF